MEKSQLDKPKSTLKRIYALESVVCRTHHDYCVCYYCTTHYIFYYRRGALIMLTLAEQPLKMESCLNCQIPALSGCPISLGFQKTFRRK